MYKIFMLIIFILINSCKSDNKSLNSSILQIKDQDIENSKSLKISDIIKTYELIPLETNDSCLIGNCKKVLISTSRIYVLDDLTKTIYLFDLNGKYLNKISRYGKGPDQYLDIDDFCLFKENNIVLLDTQRKKIQIYDASFSLIKESKFPFYADAVESLDDQFLVLKGSSFEDRLIIWDTEKEYRKESYIKYDKRYSDQVLKPFTKFNNEVLFSQKNQNLLKKVTFNGVEDAKFIDFDNRNITGRTTKSSIMGYMIDRLPSNEASICFYTETNEFVIFRFTCGEINDGDTNFTFISKKTGKKAIFNIVDHKDDVTYYISPPQIETADPNGGLVAVVLPNILLNNIAKIESKLMDKTEIQQLTSFKHRTGNIKITDNPVVVIYTLKSF